MAGWAVLCPLAVILLGVWGYVLVLRDRPAWLLFGFTFGYFLSTSLLVAMSRFRLPTIPLLIVLAAGLLSTPRESLSGRKKVLASLCAVLLGFLWWVSLPEAWLVLTDMVLPRYEP